jgi:hypothetical protein
MGPPQLPIWDGVSHSRAVPRRLPTAAPGGAREDECKNQSRSTRKPRNQAEDLFQLFPRVPWQVVSEACVRFLNNFGSP